MKHLIKLAPLLFISSFLISCDNADDSPTPAGSNYFPPVNSSDWETIDPSRIGITETELTDLRSFLAENNSRAFILLKDGKMVIEEYMGKQFDGTTNFSSSSNWYWASAEKTLTSALVGIASGEGKISINEKSSTYLGIGWSSLSTEQENQILVKHHLTMTTGVDDDVANPDCTDQACFVFKAPPGTRWAYHNGPYTILDKVIQNSTGQTLNNYAQEKIASKIGMNGQYIMTGDNNVYYSNARSMARFGLLLLNKGKWDNEQIIPEDYYNLMTTSSQQINLSYGYLTWLNGKSSYMIPRSQNVFDGFVSPAAPPDLFAAMGKNGQLINVIPSKNMVVIRIGDAPDVSLVPFTFQNDLWQKLNSLLSE